MILAIIALGSFTDSLDNYSYIIENWSQDPIMDIRPTQMDCTKDEVQLNYYRWPGTIDACDCNGGDGILTELRKNKVCNSTQERKGCQTIDGQASRDFNYFPNPGLTIGFKLCATVEEDNRFIDNAPIGGCPDGQLKCGTDDDYFYCTRNAKCPVFDIGINPSKDNTTGERVTVDQNTVLWLSRENIEQLPVVEIRVAEGDGVCLLNRKRSITSGREDYDLMEIAKEDCTRDPRFKLIYSIDEYSFYKYNNALDISDRLRGYDIDKQYKWGIYQRGYVLWKQKCRGDQMQEFIDQQILLDQIMSQQVNLLIISIIFFVIISVGFSIVSFLNITGYDWPCIEGKGTEESNYIFRVEIVIKSILQTVDAIIILVSFAAVNDEINYLSQLIDKECTDYIGQSVLIDLRDVIAERVYNYNLGQLILFIITTVLDLSIVCYLGVQALKHRYRTVPISTKEHHQKSQDIQHHNNKEYEQVRLPQEYPQYTPQQMPLPRLEQYPIYPQQDPFQQQPNQGGFLNQQPYHQNHNNNIGNPMDNTQMR